MGRARDLLGIGPELNKNEGPKLGIGPESILRARDWLRIKIFGLDPSLIV